MNREIFKQEDDNYSTPKTLKMQSNTHSNYPKN
jgi:hypothetical protein